MPQRDSSKAIKQAYYLGSKSHTGTQALAIEEAFNKI